MDSIKTFLKPIGDFLKHEWRTVLIFVAAYFLILTSAPALIDTASICLGFTLILAGCSHVVRKILFPYLNFQELVRKAKQEPLSASILAIAFSIIVFSFVYGIAQILPHMN